MTRLTVLEETEQKRHPGGQGGRPGRDRSFRTGQEWGIGEAVLIVRARHGCTACPRDPEGARHQCKAQETIAMLRSLLREEERKSVVGKAATA